MLSAPNSEPLQSTKGFSGKGQNVYITVVLNKVFVKEKTALALGLNMFVCFLAYLILLQLTEDY